MAKILLVDDEPILVSMYKVKLQNAGYDVVTASDGEKGLQTALREQPDLILLDIKMPKMDGIEVLRKLRENEWGKTVPIIMLTNVDDPDEKISQGISLDHPVYYLVKSNTLPDKLLKKVDEIINFLAEERLK